MLVQGCGAAGGARRSRGKLSQVMEKSSDKYEGERNVSSTPRSYESRRDDDEFYLARKSPEAESNRVENFSKSSSPAAVRVSFSGGPGLIAAKNFGKYFDGKVSIASLSEDKRSCFGLYAALGSVSIAEKSEIFDSLDNNVLMYSLGAEYKYYTTPPNAFLGNYIILGGGFNGILWSYKNSVTIDDDEVLSADSLGGIELFVGMGFNYFQVKGLHLGVEVLPTLVIWSDITSQGFDNDIFDPAAFIKLRGVLSVGSL